MHISRNRCVVLTLVFGAACAASFAVGLMAQAPQSALVGRTYESGDGTRLKILLDGPRQNSQVDVAEMTFPAGTNSGDHAHGDTEIFYMLEGTLEHVVNGQSQLLTPGMLGLVNPPDLVNHVVDEDGPDARALVIWSPGGLAARLTSRWKRVE